MMKDRRKPVHLVVDGLPAHKTKRIPACSRIAAKVGPAMPDLRSFAPADRDIKDYVASTKGKLTLHFLPG